jgi:hypothetical protein
VGDVPFVVEHGVVIFDDYDVNHEGVTRAVHRLLVDDPRFEVAAANYQGAEFGRICLRRTRRDAALGCPVDVIRQVAPRPDRCDVMSQRQVVQADTVRPSAQLGTS